MQFEAVISIAIVSTAAFIVAMLWSPWLVRFLKRNNFGKQIRDAKVAPIFASLHKKKEGTPTMGGVLIWVTVAGLAAFLWLMATITRHPVWKELNFLTRRETLLPMGALVASALVGLADDFLNVKKIGPKGGGLRMRHRLVLYTLIAAVGAWWFYFKLEWDTIRVPFVGNFSIGPWYIPLFILVIVATSFSVNETDGLDGLAGGTLLAAFAAFGGIAFVQGRVYLAGFCAAIIGALLAFLWFNINPARYFMGDTGSMPLGVTLGIVALLTNTVWLLPIIGVLFVLESGSVIIQVVSQKLRHGKKVFLSSPLHHHLEARGWEEPKVVMRFWVVGAVMAVVGFVLALLDRGIRLG